MAHDPFKLDCSNCKQCKSNFIDGVEVSRYCKIDGRSIECWGTDKCPKNQDQI